MKHFIRLFLAFACSVSASHAAETSSLDGQWRFALDERKEGATKEWFRTNLADTIKLPGTTDEARKGNGNSNTNQAMHLSRPFPFYGAAWYQRDVMIPESWRNKRITLFLERTKNTQVWIDDKPLGEQDGLAAPHVYDLGSVLAPGEHRLTIIVDNKKHPPVSGHQLSDDTQTDWNGIVGTIELRATDLVWIDDVQLYPNAAKKTAKVKVKIGNATGKAGDGKITSNIQLSTPNAQRSTKVETMKWNEDGANVEFEVAVGADAKLWDEFAPQLYEMTLTLESGNLTPDTKRLKFGLRNFTTTNAQFCINGKTIFLRGKHDACVFPLTGYAPMDVESWVRVFKIAKSYGINHYRCHTWCPPDAAFAAADIVGIYLQPELPNFGGDFSKDLAKRKYTLDEVKRILAAFGNHPSFVMMTLGNENFGGREMRADMIRELRSFDPRHLYSQASNYEFSDPKLAEGDDFWATMRTKRGAEGATRGSFSHADKPLGFVQVAPPSTTNDLASAIEGIPVPVIGHEFGQYETFPNFAETKKYSGVTRAWNFDVFQRRLASKGMLDQAPDFFRASGALAVLCYRADIEAALRTKGYGGFQLLDLQDFPGQGTALVGILDAFMDSKGLIAPEAWRQFCCETVPLLRFKKFEWTTAETFTAQAQIAHYGPKDFSDSYVEWSLQNSNVVDITGSVWKQPLIEAGGVRNLDEISFPLKDIVAPAKLFLKFGIRDTPFVNRYPIWVYPEKMDMKPPHDVTVSRKLDDATLKILSDGGKVLLLPELSKLTNSVEGFFASDFWCYPMFRNICGTRTPPAPGTLGLLCDPKHPALAQFPTEFHSNWQWWPIVMNSRAMILDETPASFRPIVQVIDNFERNHKLGMIFDAKIGRGKLLVCSADLPGQRDKPEARQLLISLQAYAGSQRFDPKNELSAELLKKILSAP